jgi:NadR type nicotinamide-nucleotide adenylyltransferase
MTAHGLVIGKFYPPHAGHHLLIRTAAATCRRVTVAVLAASTESIPMHLRVAWLREIHRDPDVHVIGAMDDHPVDYASETAWSAHVTVMRDALGTSPPVTAVFTSEPYGPELARRFGATHVSVDPTRDLMPCSGTAVRADPPAHWPHLADPVRAWFTTRVIVVGAESSGTTTLSRALAAHYHAPWVAEYGRERTADKLAAARATAAINGGSRPQMTDLDWPATEFTYIARRQVCEEDEAARHAPEPLIVCDTDAFATGIWHERYRDAPSTVVNAIAAELASRSRRRYLLTDHEGVPFHQDGIRDGEHLRAWMTDRFATELSTKDIPYARLTGSPEARLKDAIDAVDQWQQEGWALSAPAPGDARAAPATAPGTARPPRSR